MDRPIEAFTIQEEEVEAIAWVPFKELAIDAATHPGRYITGFKLALEQMGLAS